MSRSRVSKRQSKGVRKAKANLAIKAAERKSEDLVRICCPYCQEDLYEVSRKRLDESVDRAKCIQPKDLRTSKKVARLGQSIPLDCPYCFSDVFIHNVHGGFTVYLTPDQEFGKNYKRYPNNGSSAGIHLGEFHFLDPTGEAGEVISRAFGAIGSIAHGGE